jgi:hypothetical protein
VMWPPSPSFPQDPPLPHLDSDESMHSSGRQARQTALCESDALRMIM